MFASNAPQALTDYPMFAELWRLWQAKRTGGRLPVRTAIRLGELEALSLNVHIVEWLGPRELRFRFVGLEAIMRARTETLGHNHFDHINPALIPAYAAALNDCRQQNCGVIGHFEAIDGTEPRRMDLMVLPLENEKGDPRFGLVAIELALADLGRWSSIELLNQVNRIRLIPIDTGDGVPWPETVIAV